MFDSQKCVNKSLNNEKQEECEKKGPEKWKKYVKTM